MPEGIYTFSAPDQTNAYWNLNPTVRPGKNQNDPEFQRISNIHILGEGEKSIIRFLYYGIDQGNDFIQTSSPYVGWYLGGSEEISVRDITFTFYGTTDHRYYYNPARTISSGSDAYVTSGVQFVNVTIDQGAIGIQNQAKVEHVWVVDCNVRNTTADGIAFYGVIDGHAMYNRVENTGDDGIALWANSLVGNQGRDYVVKHNTIYEVRYGRGILMEGYQALVSDNWIEKTVGAGLVSNGTEDYSKNGALVAENNTIIRTNMSGRPDNLSVTNKNRGGIFVWGNYEDITYRNNRILGSALDGICFGSANADQITIENNEISGNERYGIYYEGNSVIKNSQVTGNVLTNNKEGTVKFAGRIDTMDHRENQSDQTSTETGFDAAEVQCGHTDRYASFRFENSEPFQAKGASEGEKTTINVKDFGAVGDGKQSDTEAVLKAIAALPDKNGVLYFPKGKYLITPPENQEDQYLEDSCIPHHLCVTGKEDFVLQGEGEQTRLIFTDPDLQGLRIDQCKNVSLKDVSLYLENQPAVRHNRALLEVTASRDVVIQGIVSQQASGCGVFIDCCTGVKMTDCKIKDAGQHGIRISAVVDGCFENNVVENARDHGIYINHFGGIGREPKRISIQSNQVKTCREGSGIMVSNGTDITVESNAIEDTYQAGINLSQHNAAFPMRKVSVTGNTLKNINHGSHVYTGGAISVMLGAVNTANVYYEDVSISLEKNTIDKSPRNGIYMDRYVANEMIIRDNQFSELGQEEVVKTPQALFIHYVNEQ